MELLMSNHRILASPHLIALLLAVCAVSCSSPEKPAPLEESVKPGINDKFLSDELDMDWAVGTFEGESREVFVSRENIAAALDLLPGQAVADIGAGTGLFLELFAEGVGAGGKVYAVDISPKFVEHMNQRVEKNGWSQVTTVLGGERSARLAEGSVDLIFACDTYHHFEYPESMLASLYRALRPGGRLVILDFERIPGVSGDWILGHVRAGKAEVTREITKAGFELVEEVEVSGLKENYVLKFRRPEKPRRPVLQIINGSRQTAEVFWLEPGGGRVSNGRVEPGEQTFITTTISHRFAIVGKTDGTERTVTSVVPIQALRFDPPDPDGIPAFYTQRANASGFPIVASAEVDPYALKEAVYLVDLMLAKRPDVRKAMIQSGARLCILAHDEFTTDQPEFARLSQKLPKRFAVSGISAKDYWDSRARGMGGSQEDPFCSCAEENLLAYPGDPYSAENILIHELAHNIHLRGMVNVDPTFDRRLEAIYDSAMAKGLWKGKYASVNHHEYFAEGVQSWFDDNREDDHDHNHVDTREELIEYDPGLAQICREVFGDTELRYTKPTTRLEVHLEGYDPGKAPTFKWPERVLEAQRQIRRDAQQRSDKAAQPSDKAAQPSDKTTQ